MQTEIILARAAALKTDRSSPIVLHLDRSGFPRGLYLERDGEPVNVEEALEQGFEVTRDDSACLLTLAARWIENLERNAK